MEIERKFLVKQLPEHLERYECHIIEQAYLCTSPVVRIRKQDDSYILTYKSKGMMVREEYNLPLTGEAYCHLREKADGNRIAKKRYVIPVENGLNIELDLFDSPFEGMMLAEVEFPTEEAALSYLPPDWLGEDVTYDPRYHNSYLSKLQLS